MGRWGYGPFDNDTAGDIVAKLTQDVGRVVDAKTDSAARHRYDSARAAAKFMLLAHDTDILGGSSIEDALRALARMRSDTEWLAWARQPKRLAKKLDEELSATLACMRACKSCRKGAQGRFNELIELVETATSAEVPKPPPIVEWRKKKSKVKAKKAKKR